MYVYRVNTGSCNACDMELIVTSLVPKFRFDDMGFTFTNSPKEAQIILITGPVTTRSVPFLQDTLNKLKNCVVIAMGICPISGGIYRDSYSIEGPLDKFVDVDINIPGCPPTPQAIKQGLSQGKKIWDDRYLEVVK